MQYAGGNVNRVKLCFDVRADVKVLLDSMRIDPEYREQVTRASGVKS